MNNYSGEYVVYTALRDISNGEICMTDVSNNSLYAIPIDPSLNSITGNARSRMIGVALQDAIATNPVNILTNGYCTVRLDLTRGAIPSIPLNSRCKWYYIY
jgi:hypothetical protein